jgi:hypothetical protein
MRKRSGAIAETGKRRELIELNKPNSVITPASCFTRESRPDLQMGPAAVESDERYKLRSEN